MAVTSVEYLPDWGEGSWNRLWQRTYTIHRRVECSSRYDGPYTIRSAILGGTSATPWLPRIGSHYFISATEFDNQSFLESVDYRIESASAWPDHATWVLTEKYGPYDASTFGANPVEWPTIWWWGSQHYDKAASQTTWGNPICNSVGDPFKDPVMVDDSRPLLYAERNELVSTFDFTLPGTFKDALNSATWNGFATDTVKCKGIVPGKPQRDSNAGVWYYTVNYEFEIAATEWVVSVLDQGFAKFDTPGTSYPFTSKRVEIKDEKGQRVSEPQLLDGSGNLLTAGGSPFYFDFHVYPETDYSVLNLDLATGLGR